MFTLAYMEYKGKKRQPQKGVQVNLCGLDIYIQNHLCIPVKINMVAPKKHLHTAAKPFEYP